MACLKIAHIQKLRHPVSIAAIFGVVAEGATTDQSCEGHAVFLYVGAQAGEMPAGIRNAGGN